MYLTIKIKKKVQRTMDNDNGQQTTNNNKQKIKKKEQRPFFYTMGFFESCITMSMSGNKSGSRGLRCLKRR